MSRRILCALGFLSLSLTIAVPAFAGTCSGVACRSKIRLMYIDSSGLYVAVTDSTSALTCKTDSGYIRLPKSHGNYDSVYTALLSAKLTGESVLLRTDDGTGPCTINYVVVGE